MVEYWLYDKKSNLDESLYRNYHFIICFTDKHTAIFSWEFDYAAKVIERKKKEKKKKYLYWGVVYSLNSILWSYQSLN